MYEFLLTRVRREEVFESISRLLIHYGSIKYTIALAHRYRDVAKYHLEGLKQSVYKDALLAFADFLLLKPSSTQKLDS